MEITSKLAALLAVITSCFLGLAPNAQTAENNSEGAGQIVIGSQASETELYAGRELQRYIYQLTGSLLPIRDDATPLEGANFVIGTQNGNTHIRRMVQDGVLKMSEESPGAQGYVLKSLGGKESSVLVIAGADTIGCLYGVYGLLDDHYNVGFYAAGDVLPDAKIAFTMPQVDESKTPEMAIRGFLPWTNFPQSATVFSWNDWKFVLDQCAKMRMNFIHIHNYNKPTARFRKHNEMFHSFSYKGKRQRAWMATVSTGHGWCMPGWNINEFRFDAEDLYDDYDFGADCTLHNESYDNDETFLKGASEFQKVINYAHTRGIKMGLGLDIDLIPEGVGTTADDPEILKSRADQIINDYPDLDYLLCFQSEKHSARTGEEYKHWRGIFMYLYDEVTKRSPHTRMAVSGWGLNPESIESLPADVICAPIASYWAGFQNGGTYGDREYWGCPWLETDGNCSQHYYPYSCDLSTTIDCYKKRAPNMKGLYCLTWRISDAIEPKLSYIAKAPWDDNYKYKTSYDVYHEYAQRCYGEEAAGPITEIINENEPFAEDHGECRHIPTFTGSDRKALQAPFIESGALKFYDAEDQLVLSVPTGQRKKPLQRYGAIIGFGKTDEEGPTIVKIATGNWIKFPVELPAEATRFELRIKAPKRSGEVELRQNAFNGPLLGLAKADSFEEWQTISGAMKPLKGKQNITLRFLGTEQSDRAKVARQLEVIDREINRAPTAGERFRLGLLRERLAGVQAYIQMDKEFPAITWDQLPGSFEPWMKSFMHRVYDISSLGNISSVQNRFVKERYVKKENKLRAAQDVQSPDWVKARGTRDGAIIQWVNKERQAAGFNVYRDGKRINRAMLPAECTSFTDQANGAHKYQVAALNAQGQESPLSVRSICPAGSADTSAPFIVLVSPPTSLMPGQALDIKVRLLDDRSYDSITAQLFYRQPGQTEWKHVGMERRTRAVFGARLNGSLMTKAGLEYFVQASDGDNSSHYPAAAPQRPLSVIASTTSDETAPAAPRNVRVAEQFIEWETPASDLFWQRIYRSRDKDFEPSAANMMTYVPKGINRFKDHGLDWNGQPLTGTWYYRITTQDKSDNESAATPPVAIQW